MMKSLSFLLLLLSMCLSSAFGETVSGSPNQVFRPFSRKHVEMLLQRQIVKIGKMDLKKLSKELGTVEWRTFDLGFLGGSGGNRMTSVYLVKDHMVVINLLSFQNLVNKPVRLYSWALHEGLGALGYDDENYELSSSLSFIAEYPHLVEKTGIDYIQENFKAVNRSKTGRTYVMSGGSTVVGGGGDAIIIELKQRLLKRYFEWVKISGNERSGEQIKRGFGVLSRFKMEIPLNDNSDYNKTTFWMEGETFCLGAGAQFILEEVYKEENLDNMLNMLREYL